ncbi:MAG: helicase, partial [Pseudomonadota bacterium]
HIPDAQKPAAQRLIALLQTLADGRDRKIAPEGSGSFELDGTWPDEDLAAQGYLRFGKRAVRADLAERLGWELSKRRKEADQAKFEIPPELASMVSCPLEDFHNVLKGFRIAPAEKDPETGAVKLWRFQSKAHIEAQEQRRTARKQARPNNARKGPRKKQDRQHGKRPHQGGGQRRPQRREPDPDSPFAVLGALLPEKPKPKPKKRKPKPAKQAAPQATPDANKSGESEPTPPPSDQTPANE